MKIIQTIASTRLNFGGTSRSVPALCDALVDLGIDNELVTTRPSMGLEKCNLPADRDRVHLVSERSLWKQCFVGNPFTDCLSGIIYGKDTRAILHDHGIWLASNHAVAGFCRRRSIPRIVSPRGMLGDWAMANSKWKKRIAWQLFQKRDLQSATAFHATSEQEMLEIRKHGFTQPITIVPNGVEFPESLPSRSLEASKQFLFMSRIHPKKGLENLLGAWKESGIEAKGWKLKIVGPDENGYRQHIEALVHRAELQSSIVFSDQVADKEKWQVYVDSDFFILPSFNENFGIVIAEALAAGVPVIASKYTPWKEIKSQGLGWWVDNDVATLANTIREAAATSSEERTVMGEKAKQWIRSTFSWSAAANQLSAFYQTLSKPPTNCQMQS